MTLQGGGFPTQYGDVPGGCRVPTVHTKLPYPVAPAPSLLVARTSRRNHGANHQMARRPSRDEQAVCGCGARGNSPDPDGHPDDSARSDLQEEAQGGLTNAGGAFLASLRVTPGRPCEMAPERWDGVNKLSWVLPSTPKAPRPFGAGVVIGQP